MNEYKIDILNLKRNEKKKIIEFLRNDINGEYTIDDVYYWFNLPEKQTKEFLHKNSVNLKKSISKSDFEKLKTSFNKRRS